MKRMLTCLIAAALLCATLFALPGCAGNPYEGLVMIDLGLPQENFGIAFRTGSDMTRRVEDITKDLLTEGKFAPLCEKYAVAPVDAAAYVPQADPCTASDDYATIRARGKLVIGITDYKPMNYKDENGKWIGFDTEYAEMVCERLGVTAEFRPIVWDNKELELAAGTIDCIWNGMTITDALEKAADCTVPYMTNTQVAVVRADMADTYRDLAALRGKKLTAEDGSAGAALIKDDAALAAAFTPVEAQTDALLAVAAGTADAAIVDMTLAKALIG